MSNALANALYMSGYSFEIKQSRDGQYYWTFHNNTGNTEAIAQSETYTTKQSCINSLALLQVNAEKAGVKDLTIGKGLLGL